MADIKVHDHTFKPYIPADEVQKRVKAIARQMEEDYRGDVPLFIPVLNGAFRFASDLFSYYDGPAEITFVRLASYSGTQSTGNVRELVSLNADIRDRRVIVVEDIVDTGRTVDRIMETLSHHQPAEVKLASLLLKPEAYKGSHPVDYLGFEIPNLFVLGYGLDYDGLGRNLNDIYQIKS